VYWAWPSQPQAFVESWNAWRAGNERQAVDIHEREIAPLARLSGRLGHTRRTPQLTVMWYALLADDDVVVLNATRSLLKERNLRRDPRMSLCIEAGMRYVTLEGRAELVDDRAQQECEVNNLIAPRYIGQRLGSRRWEVIKDSERVGIRMRVERVQARGV